MQVGRWGWGQPLALVHRRASRTAQFRKVCRSKNSNGRSIAAVKWRTIALVNHYIKILYHPFPLPMPDPATDDIIPLRVLSLLPASNLMFVVRDFSNHSYHARIHWLGNYYFRKYVVQKFDPFLLLLSFVLFFSRVSFHASKNTRLEEILSSSRLLTFILRRL